MRSLEQLRWCLAKVDRVVAIEMRRDLLVRKVAGRRLCPDCGISWNIEAIDEDGIVMPPMLPSGEHNGTPCGEHCMPKFTRRPDDQPEASLCPGKCLDMEQLSPSQTHMYTRTHTQTSPAMIYVDTCYIPPPTQSGIRASSATVSRFRGTNHPVLRTSAWLVGTLAHRWRCRHDAATLSRGGRSERIATEMTRDEATT